MRLNHPETTPPPRSVEKLSSMKTVPGAKKVGERCFKGHYGKNTDSIFKYLLTVLG